MSFSPRVGEGGEGNRGRVWEWKVGWLDKAVFFLNVHEVKIVYNVFC